MGAMGKPAQRILLGLALLVTVVAVHRLGLTRELTLDGLRSRHASVMQFYELNPAATAAYYFAVYVLSTAISIPGAIILTLAGGSIFGFWKGLVLASCASTLGATLAFLTSRFLCRDWVQKRFGEKLRVVNQGVQREGAFYLLAVRLVPAFPFFLVNLVMALTPIRTRTFYWVSQLGMLPATVVFVNAGTQLGRLESPHEIVSPALLGSFAVIGLLPLASRAALRHLRPRSR